MKFRTTFLLLLLVLLCAGAVYVLEQHTPSTEERARRSRYVLDFDGERIDWIRVQTTNYTVTAHRRGQEWVLTEPLSTRANVASVNRLLTMLEEWRRHETLRGSDLRRRDLSVHDYGLHAPRAEIAWGDAIASRIVRIGRDAPMGDAVYVQRDDEQDILAAAPNVWDAIPDQANQFRSRRLFEGSPLRTTRLEINRPDGFLRIARSPDGAWTIQQPDRGRADPGFVLDLIETLYDARIATFVSDQPGDLAPYGLDQPRVTIALTGPGDLLPQDLFIGNDVEGAADTVYARLGDTGGVVSIDRALYQTSLLNANVLRNRRLLALSPAEVGHLDIRAGAETVSLHRDPATEAWWVVRPARRKANAELVEALIAAWCTADILEFVADDVTDFTPYELDPPVFHITLGSGPHPSTELAQAVALPDELPEGDDTPPAPQRLVAVGLGTVDTERGRLFARRDDRNSVFAIDLQMLQRLSASPTYYFHHEVLRLEPDTIRSLTVEHDGTRQTVERVANGAFQPVEADAETLPAKEAIATVIETLQSLRAVEFLPFSTSALTEAGLDTPSASLTIRFTEDVGISQALLFGAPYEDIGRFATIRGQDILFILPADTVKRLLQDLHDLPAPAGSAPSEADGESEDPAPSP